MGTILKKYFPMIRTSRAVLAEISENQKLLEQYQSWNPEQQERFLDYCTGQRGIKVLYDAFFKAIMDPETKPERVEEFLSLLLNRKVRILHVHSPESPRMGDMNSLVIMDLVVELEDKSMINLEVQKMGYRFPGQRAACYSADLLLRQYRRVRSEKGKTFSYRDIHKVCTIVLYEQSPAVFQAFPAVYRHAFMQQSDTGLEMDLLQEYLFIPLDIFQMILHNKGIGNLLEAWLTFLSTDDPEMIVKLILAYPAFQVYYQEIYELCRNTEGVMEMFSKELQELDRNTVQYMMDEMQAEIDQKRSMLKESQEQLAEILGQLKEIQEQLKESQEQLEETQALRKQQAEALAASQEEIRRLREQVEKLSHGDTK